MSRLPAQLVPLEFLSENEAGRIADIDGRAEALHRLAEMGIRQGVVVRIVQAGSPCILAVGDHRFSFRPEPGTSVLVELVAAP